MEYKGKLYGKANGVTFPLLNTTDDWDKMEARIKELEDENNALKQANGAEQSDSNCNIPLVSFSEERAEVCEIDGCDLRPYGDLKVCKHHFLEQIDKQT